MSTSMVLLSVGTIVRTLTHGGRGGASRRGLTLLPGLAHQSPLPGARLPALTKGCIGNATLTAAAGSF